MGIDRRFGLDRRQYTDRRFGNSLDHYSGPERRSIFDRRNYSDRRQPMLKPFKIDLFRGAN